MKPEHKLYNLLAELRDIKSILRTARDCEAFPARTGCLKNSHNYGLSKNSKRFYYILTSCRHFVSKKLKSYISAITIIHFIISLYILTHFYLIKLLKYFML